MKTRIRIGAMKLAAYSIYVPQKTDGGGSTTVRRQLQNVLDEEEVTTERNKHLYEELTDEINKDKRNGWQVIVGGDFNEDIGRGSKMEEIMEGVGLSNLFYSKMNEVPLTRKPGKRTLDHVWVTAGVRGKITNCGMVGQDQVFISDHMGMFVDIKATNMTGQKDREKRAAHYLKTGNRRNILKNTWSL